VAADPDGAWTPGRNRPPVRISVEGLVHRYPGGVEAVRGVSLTIEPGEAVAVLGQNGSGKTTLVKHLDGLLRPDAGRVLLDGAPTDDRSVAELARTVGFVFQNPDDQLFERSVEREVAFGPRNLGVAPGDIAALVTRSLAAVGLAGERTTNPYDLDLSRRKLVALAGILAMDPAVLVLDEPTTGQDARGVARIQRVVASIAAEGRTVIAISLDMRFVAETFQRVVVMAEGRVALDGTPGEVFAASAWPTLASTYLEPPLAARVGARLGLGATATELSLVDAIAERRT
jgi:energy-coupling factor transport system ATP-binding protein